MRGCATASILLSNTTDTLWQLRPIIQNDFWSGPEFIKVRATSLSLHSNFACAQASHSYTSRYTCNIATRGCRCRHSGAQTTR